MYFVSVCLCDGCLHSTKLKTQDKLTQTQTQTLTLTHAKISISTQTLFLFNSLGST